MNNQIVDHGSWGWRPFEANANETVICHRDSSLSASTETLEALRLKTPQLNYALRMAFQVEPDTGWILSPDEGHVKVQHATS